MNLQWLKENFEELKNLIAWVQGVEYGPNPLTPQYGEVRVFLSTVYLAIEARSEQFFNTSKIDEVAAHFLKSLKTIRPLPSPQTLRTFITNNEKFQHLPPSYQFIFQLEARVLADIELVCLKRTLTHLIRVSSPEQASKNLEQIENLIQSHADLQLHHRHLNQYGDRALTLATQYNNPELVSLLLRLGADPKATDCFGHTALAHGVHYRSHHAVQVLVEHCRLATEEPSQATNPEHKHNQNAQEKTIAFYQQLVANKLRQKAALAQPPITDGTSLKPKYSANKKRPFSA